MTKTICYYSHVEWTAWGYCLSLFSFQHDLHNYKDHIFYYYTYIHIIHVQSCRDGENEEMQCNERYLCYKLEVRSFKELLYLYNFPMIRSLTKQIKVMLLRQCKQWTSCVTVRNTRTILPMFLLKWSIILAIVRMVFADSSLSPYVNSTMRGNNRPCVLSLMTFMMVLAVVTDFIQLEQDWQL